MCCGCEKSVTPSVGPNAKRLFSGPLLHIKDDGQFWLPSWKEVHAVLYNDSSLVWFKNSRESTCKGCIHLKDVAPFLLVGPYTVNIPGKPSVPKGYQPNHLICIGPGDNKNDPAYWFLCNSLEELNVWMTQIVTTLPPRPPPPQKPRDAGVAHSAKEYAPGPGQNCGPGPNYLPPPPGYGHPDAYYGPPEQGLSGFHSGLMMGMGMGYGGYGMGYGGYGMGMGY